VSEINNRSQVRGDGPVHLLVVQVTNEGTVRGLARWESVPVAERDTDEDTKSDSLKLEAVFGKEARMMISVEANEYSEPYQGIVPLEGDCLADALQAYFQTSEQLQTNLY